MIDEDMIKYFCDIEKERNFTMSPDDYEQFIDMLDPKVDIQIKYWPNSPHLEQVEYGGCVDLFNYEDISLKAGESCLIPLGVAMKLPYGFDAILIPRSSTFRRYHILQTNSVGYIDNTYCGPDDMWKAPVIATEDTYIKKGTRCFQFRLIEQQPRLVFQESSLIDETNRQGFGSSGR